MDKNFRVEIYTPLGKYLSTEADFLRVTSSVAVLGILPNHAPLVTTLEICKLTIKINSKEFNYAISGGVMNIKKDHSVVLLLNSIEASDEIDVQRALDAKKRAEERIAAHKDEIDVSRAKAALSRALNRLSISKQ